MAASFFYIYGSVIWEHFSVIARFNHINSGVFIQRRIL